MTPNIYHQQTIRISELEKENRRLKENFTNLTNHIDNIHTYCKTGGRRVDETIEEYVHRKFTYYLIGIGSILGKKTFNILPEHKKLIWNLTDELWEELRDKNPDRHQNLED